MPALYERRSDIPLLAEHFLGRYAKENGKQISGFAAAATDLMMSYHWPGNVRELENAIERAVVMANGDLIEPQHFPAAISPTMRPVTLPRASNRPSSLRRRTRSAAGPVSTRMPRTRFVSSRSVSVSANTG